MRTKRPELLSPAGNFEKLKAAILYGADAVYLAGQMFGMRAAADNFTDEELAEAVSYAHARDVRVYVTVNIMPRDSMYTELEKFIKHLSRIGADAVIVSDIGALSLIREIAPDMEIHISTQASAVSAAACLAWHKLGAKRIVLARELTLNDIRSIRAALPEAVELEAFIHGSMCIAYSGRCLLSDYLTGRSANFGMCTQPCRWNYYESELTVKEEKRPELPIPIRGSEEGGTFIMSSRDLCMIEHIPELYGAGIDSFKIEGRMKSAYYAAVTANTYKIAMERYEADPDGYRYDPRLLDELQGVSHREYDTGFFFTEPHLSAKCVTEQGYLREQAYLATALEDGGEGESVLFIQRNKMKQGDTVDLLSPGLLGRKFEVEEIESEDGEAIDATPHPNMLFKLKVPFAVRRGDILRG